MKCVGARLISIALSSLISVHSDSPLTKQMVLSPGRPIETHKALLLEAV
jgi:hypothetical protein